MPQFKWETERWATTLTREAKTIWPFLAGFAIVGFGVVKLTTSLTEEDLKNSRMLNRRHGGH